MECARQESKAEWVLLEPGEIPEIVRLDDS
jgi:hypothetical protein